jgi:hypothetical protein
MSFGEPVRRVEDDRFLRNALVPLGVTDIAMPAPPLCVWQAIQKTTKRKAGG